MLINNKGSCFTADWHVENRQQSALHKGLQAFRVFVINLKTVKIS